VPSVLIEVRKTYSREQEAGLIEAVHAALCEGFKIPPGDKNVRLVVHEQGGRVRRACISRR
jgi:hypothetical protein